ncbi:MAG: Acg family FMN-binding oxidoreductase [Allorhizobium sp.]
MIGRRGILAGTAGALVLGVAGSGLSYRLSLDDYRSYAEDLRAPLPQPANAAALVRYASLAASGHNTQPWSFRLLENAIEIRPDFSRRTPVVDPDDHHLYVSLGCALENLSIAASASGQPGQVEVIAGDGADGVGTVARFTFLGSNAAVQDPLAATLLTAIPKRQSSRTIYDGRAVDAGVVRKLMRAASIPHTGMALLTSRARIDAIRELVIAGNDAQMQDPAFVRELKDWLRFSPSQAMTRGDGLYAAASGNPALPGWIGSLAFDRVFTASAENDKYAAQMNSSAGVAVFSAETEGPEGWIAVGRACQRFALMATALGLKLAFVNQPVEQVSLRPQLAAYAGISGRRPDLVVRFGYGPSLPFSPRRPVEAIVTA